MIKSAARVPRLGYYAGGPGGRTNISELDSRFDLVGCSTGPAVPGGLSRLVRRACSRTDRESRTVGLRVGRSGRQSCWLSTLVGPGAAPARSELDSLFDQVVCSTGPAMLGGLTLLVRRAGSRTDRESRTVGLRVGRSGRQSCWLSLLIGPGAAPTGPELDSLFDQVVCSTVTGPAMLGGLILLVRRAGSRTDRET